MNSEREMLVTELKMALSAKLAAEGRTLQDLEQGLQKTADWKDILMGTGELGMGTLASLALLGGLSGVGLWHGYDAIRGDDADNEKKRRELYMLNKANQGLLDAKAAPVQAF